MAANMHADARAHQTNARSQGHGAAQRSVISSVTPLLCDVLRCVDRTFYSHTCKQMENSSRKPLESNFTNAIFTLQA